MSDLPPAHEASSRSSPEQHDVQIVTGSRLHFGLLNTVDPFGGVGVMIDAPSTEVHVSPAGRFEYLGPQEPRAVAIAKRIVSFAGLREQLPACRIQVASAAPAHLGLGSGTQLAMAIAEGICRTLAVAVDRETLATTIASRGKRSAVGIHGYYQGGLIYEEMSQTGQLNEVQRRVEMPDRWCVAVFSPTSGGQSVHGAEEFDKFAKLPPANRSMTKELRGLVADELMPSAAAGDFESFSSAVHRYNRLSGMLFAPIQGGPYNGQAIDALIRWLVDRGVTGVGQSSWGPGVFAWFESAEKAEPILQRRPAEVDLVVVARPRNQARELRQTPCSQ